MRRKYFMRGLGVGVIMTALIFTLALTFRNETITNAEVRRRAEEMGMIMPQAQTMGDNISAESGAGSGSQTTIEANGDVVTTETKTGSDVTDDTTDPTTEANEENPSPTAPSATTAPEQTTAPTSPTGPSTGGDTSTAGNTTGNPGTTNVNSGNIVKFIIREGESSSVVGANLYRAGLVDNASEFNTFLESNGYDTILHVGEFDLRTGSSYETLARKLTGR